MAHVLFVDEYLRFFAVTERHDIICRYSSFIEAVGKVADKSLDIPKEKTKKEYTIDFVDYLISHCVDEDKRIYLAVDTHNEFNIVSYIYCYIDQSKDWDGKSLENYCAILHAYFQPMFFGRYSDKFLYEIEQWARAHDCKEIYMQTIRDPSAFNRMLAPLGFNINRTIFYKEI